MALNFLHVVVRDAFQDVTDRTLFYNTDEEGTLSHFLAVAYIHYIVYISHGISWHNTIYMMA